MKNFVQLDFFYTELSKPKTLIQQSGYRPMMRLIKWSKDINKLFFMASRIWWNPLLVLNVILFKISFWIWMLDHLKFLKVTCISKYHQHIHSFSIFWFHIKKNFRIENTSHWWRSSWTHHGKRIETKNNSRRNKKSWFHSNTRSFECLL